MKTAPDPKDVQEFQFKQSSISQIFDGFTTVPVACSLLVADKKRGLLYVGHDTKLIVLKPGEDADPEWKVELDLSFVVSKIAISCECSYLAVASHRPAVLIYDAQSLVKSSLQLLHEIRITSTSADAFVNDLRWNPCTPGMLCTVASDYTVGIFQVKEEKTVSLKALERLESLDVLCAAWSPKGKQIVVGCKNGNIVQLKPDLKVARTIAGPSPSIGEVITILWISNYQFCAAYLGSEQRLNVLIVDAPKGETNAIFTCYEDITYGMCDAEGEGCIPRYYFDHVPEWGLIIAASSGSSEIAVLGSADNGVTWSQWQLVDSGRAQLPLICTTESYPVGLAIDRSPTRKLPWGADSTLPHPVPILHIFGTSGQLCSFHMVNLTPNCPAINTPPTEIISTPPPQPHRAPADATIIMSAMATSTPRPKQQQENTAERPKAAPVANIFGDSLKVTEFFKQPDAKKSKPQEQKTMIANAENKGEPPKISQSQETIKTDIKLASVKEATPQESIEQKPSIDDSICIRVCLEEQSLFEKELRSRLERQTWECGTEEERKALAEGAAIIDQFLRNLRETTNELSSEIAYLKALLLQSFAWVEETKSKNAASSDISTRNCTENSRLSELRRLYYYTQTQLTQGTKILDLEWSDHKSQEQSRMKIPSLEFVYQNLVLHNKIIAKEKVKIEQLKKRWKSLTRSNNITGLNRSMSNLSIASSKSTSSLRGNIGVIEARCKTIASKTLDFSQEKQVKLRRLLLDSTPKVIKPVNPSPIQDRLEATLSSLASLDTVNTEVKGKPKPAATTKPITITKPSTTEKPKQQSPLASLNSIVARIGSTETNGTVTQTKTQGKLPSVAVSFPSVTAHKPPQTEKKSSTPTTTALPQVKPKQDINPTFGQMNSLTHGMTTLSKAFPKVDSISFGTPAQKPQDVTTPKSLPKDNVNKSTKEQVSNKEPTKVEPNLFSMNLLKDVLPPESSIDKTQTNTPNASLAPNTTAITAVATTVIATKQESTPTFSLTFPNTATTVEKSTPQDTPLTSQATNPQTFSFALKPADTVSTFKAASPTTQPAAQSSLNLTGLSMGLQTPASLPNNNLNVGIFQYKSMNVTAVAVKNLGKVSISLANTTAPKNTVTTTASVTIEEVPATDTKVSFPESGVQTVSAPATTSIFGGQTSTLSTSMFGGTSTSTPTSTTFSAPITTTSSMSAFGTQPTTTSSMPVFAGFSNATPSTSTVSAATTSATPSPFYSSIPKTSFGKAITSLSAPSFTANASSTPSSTLTFGSPTTTVTTSSTALVFGKSPVSPLAANNQFPSTQSTSPTANAFGKPIISSPSVPFGSSSNTSVFGNVPTTSANTSIFGGSSSNSIFNANTPSSSAGSIFGGNSAMITFGTPATRSVFDNNAQKPGLVFGRASNTGNTGNTSFFVGITSSAPQTPPTASTLVFGAAPGSPLMGVGGQTALGSQPAFGQSATFGAKPVFGSPPNMFEGSKLVFGSGFSTTAFGAAATPPAFASPPAIGNPMENNMPKVFGSTTGSSTFESLASQAGGLTFGSLAQKSPEPEKPPVFTGGSSFSSWR